MASPSVYGRSDYVDLRVEAGGDLSCLFEIFAFFYPLFGQAVEGIGFSIVQDPEDSGVGGGETCGFLEA